MRCISKSNITPEMRHRIGQKKMTTAQFNQNFPVVGYWILNGGILVVRECALDSLKELRSGKRQKVTSLSPRSLHRLALLALSTEAPFKSLLTLTYGPNFPLNGEKVKYHLNFLLTKLKRSFGKFDYLWFLEFQKRGAPHFHILLTLPPPNHHQRVKFARDWANIVEPQNWEYMRLSWENGKARYVGPSATNNAVRLVHEHPIAWAAIRKKAGAARYVAKYATKLQQKTVPKSYRNVGRFWGKV